MNATTPDPPIAGPPVRPRPVAGRAPDRGLRDPPRGHQDNRRDQRRGEAVADAEAKQRDDDADATHDAELGTLVD